MNENLLHKCVVYLMGSLDKKFGWVYLSNRITIFRVVWPDRSYCQRRLSEMLSYSVSILQKISWQDEKEKKRKEERKSERKTITIMQAHRKEHVVSWEPEGHYHYSTMFCWEPEGRYRRTKYMGIAPFWFSTEHCWTALTPLLKVGRPTQ